MSDSGPEPPPLPPDSEAAARFHAYNEWLKGEESATVAKAFVAGWKAGVEHRDGQKRETTTEATGA